ncbi:MAG: sensor histidine kinase [Leptospiraceae bacterium]|nr:sensor histidine kinase [Leptospiraceae bacterium]
MKKILFVIVILLTSCQKQTEKSIPKAIKGVLDLRHFDTSSGHRNDAGGYSVTGNRSLSVTEGSFEPINLDGEWEFYWGEFLPIVAAVGTGLRPVPTIPNEIIGNINYIPVPSQWQQHGYPAHGYATYRLRVLLPKSTPKLSVAMTDAGTAYEMHINGKLVSINGKVGKSKEEMEPFYQYRTFEIESNTLELEIIIHVSNFYHHHAGLWNTIKLGSSDIIEAQSKQKIALDLIVFSALLIMGLYHIGLYFNRKKDVSPLHFGIFCILIAFRTVSLSERILMDAFPSFPFWLVLKIEYLSFYYGVFVFCQFIHSLFPKEASKRMLWIFGIVCIPNSIVVLFTPMNIYTYTLPLVQLTTLVAIVYIFFAISKAIYRKQMGAKIIFIALIIFFGTVINDILMHIGIVFTPELTSYGLLSFIFFQSVLLSIRFSNAFKESENARAYAEEQEKLAEERRLEIENLNKTKDEFLANMSHEIKTPLSIIYAYADILSTGDYTEDVKEYSNEIFTSSQILNDYVSDLVFITEIESNMQLQKAKVDLKKMIVDIVDKYKPLLEEKEIQLEIDMAESILIFCDPILMEKALLVVIKNAIVYNRQGGKVDISTLLVGERSRTIVEGNLFITDTGIGIAPEFHQKVFEKFFRVDSSLTYSVSGVGVGLFIAKKVIELHGGSIEIDSELEKGTEIRILLPLESKTDRMVSEVEL